MSAWCPECNAPWKYCKHGGEGGPTALARKVAQSHPTTRLICSNEACNTWYDFDVADQIPDRWYCSRHRPGSHNATFREELERLLNKHMIDNLVGVPDFILAAYLDDVIANLQLIQHRNHEWHTRPADSEPMDCGESRIVDCPVPSTIGK